MLGMVGTRHCLIPSPFFAFVQRASAQVKHLTAQNSLQVRGGMWFILTNETEMEVCLKNKLCIFFHVKNENLAGHPLPFASYSSFSMESGFKVKTGGAEG